MDTILMSYLLIINLIALLTMAIDKQKARRRKQRISENSLWFLSVIGGALGVWIGMYLWRHKTKHRQFVLGVPILFLIQAALLLYYYFS
ncbi:DUF1294 domain-containing protein [Ornithinibacillus sp. 4-3]|uniref:DUF1294 domain-containing protein n=1 Tax=Ornithinibacillus sp. 4-3 TaxID=3231488 RepID=A0AB39HP25_9BACI